MSPRPLPLAALPARSSLLPLLLAATTACGRSDTMSGAAAADTAGFAAAVVASMPAPAAPEGRADRALVGKAAANGSAAAVAIPAEGATDDAVIPAMVIRTGEASVRVDSLDVAIGQLRELARRLGGYVASGSMQSGSDQFRTATFQLKLPAPRFDDAVEGLRPLGALESVQINSEDVGEEYVDVTARATNAHRLEGRLIDLLAQRTGKLEEILQVEHELTRVREEIERYEGRLRYLRTRAAISTLSIKVHERAPVLREPGRSPIAEAFVQSWRNFVSFTASVITALGVLIPLGLVVGAIAWGLKKAWLHRPTTPPPPPAIESGD